MEWINAEIKPPVNKRVVIWVDDDFDGYLAIGTWDGHSWYHPFKSIKKVTHWMPLPSPPKTEQP